MVADEISHYYGIDRSKLHVIYNGINARVFHPGLADEFRASTRHSLGIPEDVPLLLYVGSGFERKGVPQLLRAFARFGNTRAHLVLVGADRKAKVMGALASHLGCVGRVHFVGAVQDVRPFYGAADGFVLPTLYDPFPNAVLEALACGLPVLTSVNCGAREYIRNGENGRVVDPVDEAALIDGLAELCELAGRTEARQLSRQQAESLTLDDMAERLLSLYRSLAN